jgi:hypothetical protein
VTTDTTRLLGKFLEAYRIDAGPVHTGRSETRGRMLRELFPDGATGLAELLGEFGGARFNGGLYELFAVEQLARWNAIVGDAFPAFRGRAHVFGRDWLGRAFALDSARQPAGEYLTLLLDPGFGEVLEVDATLVGFHNEELVERPEAALESERFRKWAERSDGAIPHGRCVGYRVPPFLGGKDDLENLEVIDAEVYWVIHGQLLTKTRDLPPGTKIGSVTFTD